MQDNNFWTIIHNWEMKWRDAWRNNLSVPNATKEQKPKRAFPLNFTQQQLPQCTPQYSFRAGGSNSFLVLQERQRRQQEHSCLVLPTYCSWAATSAVTTDVPSRPIKKNEIYCTVQGLIGKVIQ